MNFDNSQSKNGIMWEGRSLGVYSYINTKYIQVGLSVLLILLTGSRSPTLGIRLNGGLTFLLMPQNPNNKESASQGHRCSGNLLQIWQKEDVRNVAQSFQTAQQLVLIVDVPLSNKQKQRHKICRSHDKMIPIKRFRNYFGRANFIKSFVVANLTWHNASMKLVHYGGKLLQCGGNALLRNLQHSVAVQQEENSFLLSVLA